MRAELAILRVTQRMGSKVKGWRCTTAQKGEHEQISTGAIGNKGMLTVCLHARRQRSSDQQINRKYWNTGQRPNKFWDFVQNPPSQNPAGRNRRTHCPNLWVSPLVSIHRCTAWEKWKKKQRKKPILNVLVAVLLHEIVDDFGDRRKFVNNDARLTILAATIPSFANVSHHKKHPSVTKQWRCTFCDLCPEAYWF